MHCTFAGARYVEAYDASLAYAAASGGAGIVPALEVNIHMHTHIHIHIHMHRPRAGGDRPVEYIPRLYYTYRDCTSRMYRP